MNLDYKVFEEGMKAICAAFGRKVQDDNMEYWYKIAKDLSRNEYLSVVGKLQFGEHFPTFGVFREAKNEVKNKTAFVAPPKSKCKWCDGDGKLVYEDALHRAYIGRCMACKLSNTSTVNLNPINPTLPPDGYTLHASHVLHNKHCLRILAEGGDPWQDVVGNRPVVAIDGTPERVENESARQISLQAEQERDLEPVWNDNF